jgi:hypothetical protein
MPRDVRPSQKSVLAVIVWLALGGVLLLRVSFLNDHFDRISRGRQILAYGDHPFADFRDPGYFLTLYASAAAQALTGGGLLGEAVLTSAAIALSGALTFWLVEMLTGSLLLALATAGLTALAQPRYYDYDKVLFYMLGLTLAWRYADSPTRGRLCVAGAVTAFAALFRYDNGLFVMLTSLATIIARRLPSPRQMSSDAAVYVAAVLLSAAPALVFLQAVVGLPEAFRQIAAYAAQEGERSELFGAPRLAFDSTSVMYVLTVTMVPAALLRVAVGWRARHAATPEPDAKIIGGAVLLACVCVFILRDPIAARIGAAIPPAAVLAASLVGRREWPSLIHTPHGRLSSRQIGLIAAAIAAAAIVAQARGLHVQRIPLVVIQRLVALATPFGPPAPGSRFFPAMAPTAALVTYLNSCTPADAHVLVTWFAPEVYYFSQRGFAGGMAVVLGRHWSSEPDQHRTIEQLATQNVPVVIVRTGDRFDETFPRLATYLHERYRNGGMTTFGATGLDAYDVLIRRDLGDVSTDPRWMLPCPRSTS